MERKSENRKNRQILLADMHGDGVHFDAKILARNQNKNREKKGDKSTDKI